MVEAPPSEFPVASGESVPLVAILGPTASGKSALAVRIARQFHGEVIACDSTQVYRGLDIGTAKPTPAEQSGIPHHMMDLVEPDALFTAGEYRRRALVLLADLRRRGRLPVFTAGTGLYLRALLEGLADAPERSEKLRARLSESARRHGQPHLHRMLRRLDPAAASRISPNDTQKLIRALEMCLLAGRPLTEIHRAGREPLQGFVPVKIGLHPPREALHERIARRVQEMLERGWLAEVAALIARGTAVSAKPFEFIGYRELRAHLVGEKSLEEAAQAITQATRQYAKRQMTWFRREPGVVWFAGFGDEPHVVAAALALLDETLRRAPQKAAVRPGACSDRV
jgi:tRNA dimethylallyltransferase